MFVTTSFADQKKWPPAVQNWLDKKKTADDADQKKKSAEDSYYIHRDIFIGSSNHYVALRKQRSEAKQKAEAPGATQQDKDNYKKADAELYKNWKLLEKDFQQTPRGENLFKALADAEKVAKKARDAEKEAGKNIPDSVKEEVLKAEQEAKQKKAAKKEQPPQPPRPPLEVPPATEQPTLPQPGTSPAETSSMAPRLNPFGPPPGPVRRVAESGWHGFYFGGEAAFNRTSDDVGLSLGGDWDRIPSRFSDEIERAAKHEFDENAFALGVYAGYLFQFNRLVVGPEIDVRKIWESEGTFDTENSADTFRVRSGFHTNFAMTADARVGYSFGKWLPYFIAGAAFSNLHANQTLSLFEQSGGEIFKQRGDESEFQAGWTVGVGVEYKLTPNWSMRAQYRYLDFGTLNFSSHGTNGFDGFTGQHSAELTEHWADFGVTYRFGGFGREEQ